MEYCAFEQSIKVAIVHAIIRYFLLGTYGRGLLAAANDIPDHQSSNGTVRGCGYCDQRHVHRLRNMRGTLASSQQSHPDVTGRCGNYCEW